MASETLIQVEAAEASYWIANLLAEILYEKKESRVMPRIECHTDNHQLYDAVYSLWIVKELQLADSLTKVGASSTKLLEVFAQGQLQEHS